MHGHKLRRWRYDARTEKLVEEILERDCWSEKQWNEWREEHLSFLLHRAATKVPFYRDAWARRRRNGDKASWEYLENWEVLEKKSLRENPRAFVADDCRISKMYHSHTSGTTGTSLDLWLTRETVREWYAMFEARWRYWYGVSRRDRWAILGGQLVTPVKQNKPPFWVWNSGLNQLYMSSYHLSPDLIDHYFEALKKYRVQYLWGYSSALYSLAKEVAGQKRSDIRLKAIITNAEPLLSHQRETIEAGFNCPVRETYGMAEMVAAASECDHRRLHQWPDAGIIEALASRERADGFGDFICTGLVNADMPLIRYRVGDCGTLSEEACGCGKKLPVIEKIEGRSDDVLYTTDGRQIGRLDPVFKNDLPIAEAQIIQKSLEQILVRYVPAHNFNDRTTDVLTERIRDRMGEVRVNFEEVSEIPRTNNGKFRAVICKLSAEERALSHEGKRRKKMAP